MKTAPCKSCNSRTVTCHGTCTKYLLWRAGHRNEARKISELRDSRRKIKPYAVSERMYTYGI